MVILGRNNEKLNTCSQPYRNKEMAMSMLKALNIVALPKLSKNDPTLQRRINC